MRPASLLLCAALSLSACKKKDAEADGTKVTTESTYSAKDAIVHEGLRFELALPGPSWKTLRAEDIQQLVPDAVAGATSGKGAWGVVIAERLPGATLKDAEAMIEENLVTAVVESREELEFVGLPARKAEFTMSVEGLKSRYVRICFLREGFLYQLLAWGPDVRTDRQTLQPFFDAFSLTPGEITGNVDNKPPVEHARGITWRVEDGVFESAVSGLRGRAPEGWRLVVGDELRLSDSEAEVMLTHEKSGAFIAVIAERSLSSAPGSLVAQLRQTHVENLGPGTPQEDRTLDGHTYPVLRHPMGALSYDIGVLEHDGAVLQLMSWFPTSLESEAAAAIAEGFAAFSVMPEKARAALASELSTAVTASELRRLTKDARYIDGEYRHFGHGLGWKAPEGLFDVRIGDANVQMSDAALLVVEAPLESAFMMLELVEGGAADVSGTHDAIAGDYRDRKDSQQTLGSISAQVSTGSYDANLPFVARVVSFPLGADGVHVTAWGTPHPGQAETLTRLTDGIVVSHFEKTRSQAGRFYDHQFGFSVTEPDGVRSDDPHNPDFAKLGIAHFVQWKSGRRSFSITSLPTAGTAIDDTWLTRFAEQEMRDRMAKQGNLGKPESSAFQLDGAMARRIDYGAVLIVAAVYGPSMHIIAIEGASDDEAQAFLDGFRWH